MKLKKARNTVSSVSSGSIMMYAALAAERAMPIGTLSISSTRAMIPVMYIPAPLSDQPVRSVAPRPGIAMFTQDAASEQSLNADVDLKENGDRHKHEPAEQHREEGPHW